MARLTARRIPPTMPGMAAGKQHLEHRFRLRGPDRERAVAQAARHGPERVIGKGRDERDQHDPHDAARRERGVGRDRYAKIATDVAQGRRDDEDREKAVDDRRHPGEDLQHRLDDGPHAGVREFVQVDRRQQPDGRGDEHRDRRDDQRAEEHRQHAERALGRDLTLADRDLRLPRGAQQEIPERNFLEEPECLERQRGHDADGDEDRRRRTGHHQAVHDRLEPLTRPEIGSHPAARHIKHVGRKRRGRRHHQPGRTGAQRDQKVSGVKLPLIRRTEDAPARDRAYLGHDELHLAGPQTFELARPAGCF